MYQPSATDLATLGFRNALSTSGIWHHKEAGVWLVSLPPSGYAFSTDQYTPGVRHQASGHTKASFYETLCATAPKWDFKTKRPKKA